MLKDLIRRVTWRRKHGEALKGQASSGHLSASERSAEFQKAKAGRRR